MQVETFEVGESVGCQPEVDEEARELIDKLELEGQKTLISPNESQTRIPYRQMTAEERYVYRTLCPTEVKIAAYERMPIPLRVLQVAAHADSLAYFDEICVWDAASAAERDPVLVGKLMDKYSTNGIVFILARWGEELDEWPALLNRAIAKGREKLTAALAKIKAVVSAQLADADMASIETLMQSEPNYYWTP